MESRNIPVNAQLGCGAIILVAIAAWFGANMASRDLRPVISSSDSRPPIFAEGKIVKKMGGGGDMPSVIFRVIEVSGPWVKLKADTQATYEALLGGMFPMDGEGLPAASNPATNPVLGVYERLFGGEWWLNTSTTSDLWQAVPEK